MDLKEINNGIDPASHWYFKVKRRLLVEQVPKNCASSVDVGAGSKFFSYELAKVKSMSSVFSIDPNFETEVIENLNQCQVTSLQSHGSQIKNAQFWVFMDVIEHIEDDVEFLRSYVEISPSGSSFFITVPAFSFMWSQHDVSLGHFRRYTRKSLMNLITRAGLKELDSGYFYCSVFPLAYIQRKLISRFMPKNSDSSGLSTQLPFLNRLLELLVLGEFKITRGFGKFPGLTVTCIATKP